MQQDNIQWFPGHMAKTRRLIAENLKLVDIVIEVLDARIPYSSRNPEIPRLIGDKPTLILLNKAHLADRETTAAWQYSYTKNGAVAIPLDCLSGEGIHAVEAEIKKILSAKLERYENKGMAGRALKAMIVGIPNVGKSSLINRICGTKKVKVEDRPGVTLNKQWVPTK
ncbi:MAG: ribosome biogenesis GTPase YlqF, partial [Clostridia bacterium]|nr:ribosome biogenesis GTPase YlqF [Clostridia bacterium]